MSYRKRRDAEIDADMDLWAAALRRMLRLADAATAGDLDAARAYLWAADAWDATPDADGRMFMAMVDAAVERARTDKSNPAVN